MFPFIGNSREFRNRRCRLRGRTGPPPALSVRRKKEKKRSFSHGVLPPVDPPWCRAESPVDRTGTWRRLRRQGRVWYASLSAVGHRRRRRQGSKSRAAATFHTARRHEIKRRKGRVAHPVAMWASFILAPARARDGTQKTKPRKNMGTSVTTASSLSSYKQSWVFHFLYRDLRSSFEQNLRARHLPRRNMRGAGGFSSHGRISRDLPATMGLMCPVRVAGTACSLRVERAGGDETLC